jgi:dTDP-glucose 4,6-dehydratase
MIVTGGAGFIGFNFVRQVLAAEPQTHVVVLDRLTYAGNPRSLAELQHEPRLTFVHGDIGDRALVARLLDERRPQAVVNFAAESHVDRSIVGPDDFIQTNVVGTFHLLDEVRKHLGRVPAERESFRLLHVSTDEVYGALGPEGAFHEGTPYAPNSPYSASKAASDHLVRAYHHTYGVPVVTTNCSNNYGPYQFPEKLIPLTITNALAEKPLPVYGKGQNVRDWIFVEDHCAAVLVALRRGKVGETYVIGARSEQKNLDVVHTICDELDRMRPRAGGASHRQLVTFVTDRLGHDFRYAIDPSKIERELGWRPQVGFAEGIRRTIEWYLQRQDWSAAILSGEYRVQLPRTGS